MNTNVQKPFFPFGFQYPKGFPYSDHNPDPKIESVRLRMEYLNDVHQRSGLPGHIFAAAMALFQSESPFNPDIFWSQIETQLDKEEVAEIARSIVPKLGFVAPPLDFPNAIVLFDCRFVSTSEWEHIRRYSIGGSEAATVLGLSKFQTPLSLYHEKRTPYTEKYDMSRQQILDYGHAIEDYIVDTFASRLGAVRYPEYRMFAHKEYPFLTCNPDGILLFADGHMSLFEAKSAFWRKRDDWKDSIPPYYEPQPRHYLEVLNDPRLMDGYIGVCLGAGDNDLIPQHYLRDTVKGKEQTQKLVDYWKNHIEANVPPPFSGKAALDLDAAYGYTHQTAGPSNVDLSETTIPDFENYFFLQQQKKQIDSEARVYRKQEEQLLNQIIPMCPDGLTLCTLPNEMTYRIQIKDKKTQSVNFSELAKRSGKSAESLMNIATKLKEVTHGWTTPKINSHTII